MFFTEESKQENEIFTGKIIHINETHTYTKKLDSSRIMQGKFIENR